MSEGTSSGRRFAAIALPAVRVALARGGACGASGGGDPLAVVIARPGGVVQKETDLLGNTRLDEVSEEAHRLGVRAGHTIAAARAKAAHLRVRVVTWTAIREELGRIAEACHQFGTTVSITLSPRGERSSPVGGGAGGENGAVRSDSEVQRRPRARPEGPRAVNPPLNETDVIWVDITGCAHLFGGESALVSGLIERVRGMGHRCRVAVADGPRVAAALARYGRAPEPIVVPPGANAEAIRPLPLRALPLDDETRGWLRTLGARTVGDVQRLPKRALGNHLGAAGEPVMLLLAGEDRAPLAPHRFPEEIEEQVELDHSLASLEALLFVTKSLCDRVASRLVGRGMAAARLELILGLDKAVCEIPSMTTTVAPPSPLARPSDLFGVLRARLESRVAACIGEVDFERPPPVRTITLRVPEIVRGDGGRSLELFEPEAKAEAALPRLVAELVAELGASSVGTLRLANTWAPGRRTTFVPFGARDEGDASARLLAPGSAPEPTRWLPEPRPLEREALSRPILFARLEMVEWWRRGAETEACDYGIAWVERAGGRTRGPGWFEHDRRTKQLLLKGWLD